LIISLAMKLPLFDKGIAFDGWKYRGAVFTCQRISCIEKQGLAMRLEKEAGMFRVSIDVIIAKGNHQLLLTHADN
jgi:hypothetical protein